MPARLPSSFLSSAFLATAIMMSACTPATSSSSNPGPTSPTRDANTQRPTEPLPPRPTRAAPAFSVGGKSVDESALNQSLRDYVSAHPGAVTLSGLRINEAKYSGGWNFSENVANLRIVGNACDATDVILPVESYENRFELSLKQAEGFSVPLRLDITPSVAMQPWIALTPLSQNPNFVFGVVIPRISARVASPGYDLTSLYNVTRNTPVSYSLSTGDDESLNVAVFYETLPGAFLLLTATYKSSDCN